MGGELGDETYIDVPLVSLALFPPILTLIVNTNIKYLDEFSVEKLVLLSVRGYLGEIESGEEKSQEFFIYIYLHMQCCVRVSASNFRVRAR